MTTRLIDPALAPGWPGAPIETAPSAPTDRPADLSATRPAPASARISTAPGDQTTAPDLAPTAQQRAWRRARAASRRRWPLGLIASLAILSVVLTAAFFPHWLSQVDPTATDLMAVNRPPSWAHPAGTDYLGRDVFARIVYGARHSLLIGLGATAISALIGVVLGVLAGISKPWVDTAVSRFVDILAAFPGILLALVVIALIGPGLVNLIVALGVSHIPSYARVVRAQTGQVVRSDYVEQARTLGWGRFGLTWRHVLPNALGVVPVLATIGLGGAIVGAAALSFIGMGPQPPTPEWGAILAESRNYLRQAWWTGVLPGVALTATVIASTVVGRTWQASSERRTP
ncbi:MAG: ABC transporter permease [Propionibacteriaceae bacterium]|jgi:peptide/nickel transport system permease protein|nr:ABC transporter permease [Propionibacteriaceae bacterium]